MPEPLPLSVALAREILRKTAAASAGVEEERLTPLIDARLRPLVEARGVPVCLSQYMKTSRGDGVTFERRVILPCVPVPGMKIRFENSGADIEIESVSFDLESGEVDAWLPAEACQLSEYQGAVKACEADGFKVHPDDANGLAKLLALTPTAHPA